MNLYASLARRGSFSFCATTITKCILLESMLSREDLYSGDWHIHKIILASGLPRLRTFAQRSCSGRSVSRIELSFVSGFREGYE
jgi:hypothetical protein